jgi:ATPase subunit of ABC transporter with duplicated ATPase domains
LQTGTWANGKQKYKSRKVAIYGDVFSLMGFVKLRNMSDEEFNDYQDKQEHMKQQNAVIKQQKQEKIRREQENIKLEREQKMQEEAEKQKQIEKKRQEKEQAEKAEQERLAGMSPDDREKVKYEKASPSDMGTFVNASLIKEDLTVDFYKWLKNYLESKKLWTVNVDDKKNKWVKRCLAIEEKLK